MVINIYTALNGVGLERDYKIIRSLIPKRHDVRCLDFLKKEIGGTCDLAIHLEIPILRGIQTAKKNILIPNPEWFFPQWCKNIKLFDEIWCKTHDCYNVFSKMHPNCVYTSFMSEDMYDERIKREREFIHVAGKSKFKGTEYLIKAYERNKDLPICYLISSDKWKTSGNLILIPRLPENELRGMLNSKLFHVCPSIYEGWGHYIHEALSLGNVVLTTDHPPMNEFVKENLIKSAGTGRTRMAETCIPDIDSISRAILDAYSLSDDEITRISYNNREKYLNMNQRFSTFIKSRIN